MSLYSQILPSECRELRQRSVQESRRKLSLVEDLLESFRISLRVSPAPILNIGGMVRFDTSADGVIVQF